MAQEEADNTASARGMSHFNPTGKLDFDAPNWRSLGSDGDRKLSVYGIGLNGQERWH